MQGTVTEGVLGMPSENQWAILKDNVGMRPIAKRVLIQEDEFKSTYDCKNCEGRGHLGIICKYCKGTKWDKGREENGYCRDCTVGASGAGRTLGFVPCDVCHGKGGTIVVPDDTKKPPTTGTVLAIGSLVTEFIVGNRVMYHNYSGTKFEAYGFTLRMMDQHDVLCEIKNFKGTSLEVPLDDDQKVGVASGGD